MKKNELTKLRSKKREDLEKLVNEKKLDLTKTLTERSVSSPKNLKEAKNLRLDIAQIKTILREIEIVSLLEKKGKEDQK